MAEVIDLTKARLERAQLTYAITITHTSVAMGIEVTGIDLEQEGAVDMLVGDLRAAIDALTGNGYTEVGEEGDDIGPTG